MGFKEFVRARPLRAKANSSTSAAELTLRQSVFPIILVTILFFLWGFSYGTSFCSPSRAPDKAVNPSSPQVYSTL